VADINLDAVPYQPVFAWMQDVGGMDTREMLRTFNCGVGMIVVLAAKDAKSVSAMLKKSGEKVVTLGTMRRRKGQEAQIQTSGTLSAS
jgi:phosphoribosylformylglycinamidine cyclo-ligase